jgi:hypothetical protein
MYRAPSRLDAWVTFFEWFAAEMSLHCVILKMAHLTACVIGKNTDLGTVRGVFHLM